MTLTMNESKQLENIKGSITLAGQTIKSLELVNGGAAVGLLTFYGNVLVQTGKLPFHIEPLKCGLTCFAAGVFAAVVCAMFAYLAQYKIVCGIGKMGERLLILGAGVPGLISAGLFVAGVWESSRAFG